MVNAEYKNLARLCKENIPTRLRFFPRRLRSENLSHLLKTGFDFVAAIL
jgi:hypothetical protein